MRRKEGHVVKPEKLARNAAEQTGREAGTRYTVEQLLSESESPKPLSKEDREWVDAPRVGRELI